MKKSHSEYIAERNIALANAENGETVKLNEKKYEDALRIVDLEDKLKPNMPILIEPKMNKPFKITNYLAIVLHQDMLVNEDAYTSFIPKVISSQARNFHFVIDKEGVIFKLNPVERAVMHCKYKKYSKRASEYFGEIYCPIYEDTEKTPHDKFISPNLCTISICVPKINDNGDMGNLAYTSLIKLCAYLINCYAKYLQAQANIICNYYIPEDKTLNKDPLCFYSEKDYSKLSYQEIADLIKKNDEENNSTPDAKYLRFRYEVERLRGEWYMKYRGKGIIRGYPDIIYQTIEE